MQLFVDSFPKSLRFAIEVEFAALVAPMDVVVLSAAVAALDAAAVVDAAADRDDAAAAVVVEVVFAVVSAVASAVAVVAVVAVVGRGPFRRPILRRGVEVDSFVFDSKSTASWHVHD